MDFGNSLDSYLGYDAKVDVIPFHYVVEYTSDSDHLQARWRAKGKVDDEFINQLRQLPEYRGLVYRGVLKEYALSYSAALSTSKEYAIAKRFACLKGSVVCAYYGYKDMYDVSGVSEFPGEQEILCLMPPGSENDVFHAEERDGMMLFLFAPPDPELRKEALELLSQN